MSSTVQHDRGTLQTTKTIISNFENPIFYWKDERYKSVQSFAP